MDVDAIRASLEEGLIDEDDFRYLQSVAKLATSSLFHGVGTNHRKDSPGRHWGFMKKYTFGRETPLITRLRIVSTPWFGVYLHKHYRPDQDSDLHDHPWPFFSVILKGGYIEHFAKDYSIALVRACAETTRPGAGVLVEGMKNRLWKAGSVHGIRRHQYHKIFQLQRVPTWTLLVVGPRAKQEWGFATTNGFIDHRTYFEMKDYDRTAD